MNLDKLSNQLVSFADLYPSDAEMQFIEACVENAKAEALKLHQLDQLVKVLCELKSRVRFVRGGFYEQVLPNGLRLSHSLTAYRGADLEGIEKLLNPALDKITNASHLAESVRRWRQKSVSLKKTKNGEYDARSADGRFMKDEFLLLETSSAEAQTYANETLVELKNGVEVQRRKANNAAASVPDEKKLYRTRRYSAMNDLAPSGCFYYLFFAILLLPLRPFWSFMTITLCLRYALGGGLSRDSHIRRRFEQLEFALGINANDGLRSLTNGK